MCIQRYISLHNLCTGFRDTNTSNINCQNFRHLQRWKAVLLWTMNGRTNGWQHRPWAYKACRCNVKSNKGAGPPHMKNLPNSLLWLSLYQATMLRLNGWRISSHWQEPWSGPRAKPCYTSLAAKAIPWHPASRPQKRVHSIQAEFPTTPADIFGWDLLLASPSRSIGLARPVSLGAPDWGRPAHV